MVAEIMTGERNDLLAVPSIVSAEYNLANEYHAGPSMSRQTSQAIRR
jgi:hypothetical protein